VTRISGINLGLGYSMRHYTSSDGMRPGRLNFYWGWGTLVLILPYVEFGVSYPIALGGESQFVVDLGALYIIPYIGLSFHF